MVGEEQASHTSVFCPLCQWPQEDPLTGDHGEVFISKGKDSRGQIASGPWVRKGGGGV